MKMISTTDNTQNTTGNQRDQKQMINPARPTIWTIFSIQGGEVAADVTMAIPHPFSRPERWTTTTLLPSGLGLGLLGRWFVGSFLYPNHSYPKTNEKTPQDVVQVETALFVGL
jgi:hypothetical protein